jgi:plastocyanin
MLVPGRGRSTFVAAFLAATIASAIAAASSFGAAQTIVAIDDAYLAAAYTMDQGDRPTLMNNGVNLHNVTSRSNGPDGDFLFISPTIGSGSTTVEGTQYLTAGNYAFFCTTHPLSMSGTLQVSGAGTPVARPKIDVVLGAGKVDKIAKKGKVPVTVKGLTQSTGVELVLKLGKATIGTQKAFDLAAGQTRKLNVKLTKSGKSKLAKKDKAAIKATGEVPFGAPDSAKRTYKS